MQTNRNRRKEHWKITKKTGKGKKNTPPSKAQPKAKILKRPHTRRCDQLLSERATVKIVPVVQQTESKMRPYQAACIVGKLGEPIGR